MRRKCDSTQGTVILETSISLFMFIMVFLFLYGLFSLASAQNQMTHALIQSSKSLSLDPYLTEHVDSAAESKTFWTSLGSMILDFARISNDPHFASSSDWYNGTGEPSLAKDRFVGFLSGGDENAANEKLKKLGVVNGLNGVSFVMVINGEDMKITMRYKIQFVFDGLGLGTIPMEHSVTTRLWK